MRKPKYIPIPIAYDIETTSYRDDGEKAAIVYTHTFSVDGEVSILRTWDEVYEFLGKLIHKYNANLRNRIVIYVHNLAYEFGFMRKYFHWDDVMAIGSSHRIARATTIAGIEFRCSYLLTNASLAYVGGEVGVEKMVGDLDYDLMRHHETPLTDEETGYIVNDVQIIIELIRQRMEQDGGLAKIPMTKTGYVRRMVRGAVTKSDEYTDLIRDLPLTEDIYVMARKAFQGGYVHANATHAGKIIDNVTGYDLASSYPASMIKGHYPMARFVEHPKPSLEAVNELLGNAVMLIDVTLYGVTSRYPFPPISESKALHSKNTVVDNGRIYTADSVRVIITDVDLMTICRAYDIDHFDVHVIQVSYGAHLPRVLGDAVLSYYRDKTVLKGVSGEEERYKIAKENTNSIFGMVATDPVRDDYRFDHALADMVVEPIDITEAIHDHNASRGRFLFYPWACWITAYSRSTLLHTIYDLIDAGVEVLYCDTDSIYFIDHPLALGIIEARNDKIIEELKGYFDTETPEEVVEMLSPKTVKGDRKTLGVFEFDGSYDRFKTLGAKRYATLHYDKEFDTDRFTATVSGLSKKAGDWVEELPDGTRTLRRGYVSRMGGLDFFKDGMVVPAEHSGRLVHAYSNETVSAKMIDYTGKVASVRQEGFVHLEATDYKLGLSEDYLTFIEDMEMGRI